MAYHGPTTYSHYMLEFKSTKHQNTREKFFNVKWVFHMEKLVFIQEAHKSHILELMWMQQIIEVAPTNRIKINMCG